MEKRKTHDAAFKAKVALGHHHYSRPLFSAHYPMSLHPTPPYLKSDAPASRDHGKSAGHILILC